MIVYSWPGKFTLVTEQRCGSSLLSRISRCDDSPLKIVPDIEIEQFLKIHINSNLPIYVLGRDLHHRRSSAVRMHQSVRIDDCADQINFLDGYITAFARCQLYHQRGFYNFCFDDSHVDWGTSLYYHYLNSVGVKNLNLLWLRRPNILESCFELPPLNNFLCDHFDHHRAIKKVVHDQIDDLERRFNKTNTRSEFDNIILYETYNKQFRELTDHRDDVLKYSDWVWCEQFMNNTMIDMHQKRSTYKSSEVLEIVSQKLEIINAIKVYEANNKEEILWWPGKRLMDLRPDLFGL